MAVRYYDEALLTKLKKWVSDEKMKITGPDETRRLFEYRADINNDKPITNTLVNKVIKVVIIFDKYNVVFSTGNVCVK